MYNHIAIMGRIGKLIELQHTKNGTPVTSFTLACDRNFVDKQTGERETDWFSVVCWSGKAEFVSRYCMKGDLVVVEGRLQNREWVDDEGKRNYRTEIIADNVYFGWNKRRTDGAEQDKPGDAEDVMRR